MGCADGEPAPSTLVVVNHECVVIFAHAATGNGIEGDRLWLAKRVAKDTDNLTKPNLTTSRRPPFSQKKRANSAEARLSVHMVPLENRDATAAPRTQYHTSK